MVGGFGWVVFGLVTPQDGLVTPPVWGFTAELLKKRSKFGKTVEIASK